VIFLTLQESVFNVPLSKSLPEHLKPEGVVAAQMPHLKDPAAMQRHLLNKYDKQALRNFGATNSDPGFLRQVYGRDSPIYQNAKAQSLAIGQYRVSISHCSSLILLVWFQCCSGGSS
jgi:hypothetical protein